MSKSIDKRVNYQRQDFKCCYNCPHGIYSKGNVMRCELAYEVIDDQKVYRHVEPTNVCESYPECKLSNPYL